LGVVGFCKEASRTGDDCVARLAQIPRCAKKACSG
jgi:hypothetical protein